MASTITGQSKEGQSIRVSELMATSGVKFGTSGARSLVADMTSLVCYAYTLAFVQCLLNDEVIVAGDSVMLAGDYRPSTPTIMTACSKAIEDAGLVPVNCGRIPTPALALMAMQHHAAGIMVTGSHIPDDRNGIKFYRPDGEILKHDEQAISAARVILPQGLFDASGSMTQNYAMPEETPVARELYLKRYMDLFAPDSLKDMRIGIYQHSSVARDLLVTLVRGLGADVMILGRSEQFIPVDTEAIREEDVELARQWADEYELDSIISTDGDADRPLISDENGEWLRGDIAGVLCAQQLGIENIVTPISSNTVVEKSGFFEQVVRTRIGSPFVIEAMNTLSDEGAEKIAGYEANGGFLLQSDIHVSPSQILSHLPTRDAVIVLLAILVRANAGQVPVSVLMAALPHRYTFSDRLKNMPSEISQSRLAAFSSGDRQQDIEALQGEFGETLGKIQSVDHTDGVRMTLLNGEIVHLRASGNAPELRCYSEAASPELAVEVNRLCMQQLKNWS